MSSDRRHVAAALAVLALSCMERQGTKPPTFPGGGLLARATPLPDPRLLSALEGVYDTTSRFGKLVVVHASVQGSSPAALRGAVSILGRDHIGFAILEPGCLASGGSTQLVLEGYWRYLEDAEPDAGSTGLVRLFVQPDAVAAALCAGNPAPAGAVASLSGAAGGGNTEPTDPLQVTFVQPRKSRLVNGQKAFFVGAHRGGCLSAYNCGQSENVPEEFVFASRLGADFVEFDVQLTADGVPVLFHDPSLSPGLVQGPHCTGKVADHTYAQLLADCRLRYGETIPRLEDHLQYGLTTTDLVVWLDMKTAAAVVPASQVLGRLAARLPDARVMERVVMGLPAEDVRDAYVAAQSGQLAPGQRCLVEQLESDLTSIPCQAWVPRYTRGPMADAVQRVQAQGKFAGYWTISDETVMDAFLTEGKPNGILTNFVGLLNQRWEAVGVLPAGAVSP